MKNPLENLSAFPWLTTLISLVTGLLGIFAGPILETRVKPLVSTDNIPITIFVLVTIVFITSILMWDNIRQQVTRMTNHTGLLARSVGHQVRILSIDDSYRVLLQRVKSAKEVLIFSNYAFDWDNGRPLYAPSILENTSRKTSYSFVWKKLEREKGKRNFRYIRIVQVPRGHNIEEIFPHDPIFKKECEILSALGKEEPEFASLRISETLFKNTFVLVDRGLLHIEYEIDNPETGEIRRPFAILVEDPDSIIIQDLLSLHQRLQAISSLYQSTNTGVHPKKAI